MRQVDDTTLDSLTDRAEACLSRLRVATPAELSEMLCVPFHPIPRSIDRAGFNVKVAPDWHWSACHTEQQLFPCSVDPMLCDAEHLAEKGAVPDPRCPCECRATVQDNRTVVTAPNLLVYVGELLRLVTACNNVWRKPLLDCAGIYP